MRTGADRPFAEVAGEFEHWRNRSGELLGCGEWESRWRLSGGLSLAQQAWPEELGPCVLVPRDLPPLATVPCTLRAGERREAWFREAHRQLDEARAAMLGKRGGRP